MPSRVRGPNAGRPQHIPDSYWHVLTVIGQHGRLMVSTVRADFRRLQGPSAITSERHERATYAMTIAPRWQDM